MDADEAFCRILAGVLGPGYALRSASSIEAALPELDAENLDAILLNLNQPESDRPDAAGVSPSALLEAASERPVALPVILYGWDARRQMAMQLMQQGALDFFLQPLDIQGLKFALDRAHRRTELSRELAAKQEMIRSEAVEGLLGNSRAMQQAKAVIHKVAGVFTSVLITGESGTGKEVAARAIHRMSARAHRQFVAFSVCALPESLLEDELFGHEKGAFTGANQARRGRFEEAQGGTIFLDEIADLALPLQTKLLRVLQERTVERLGSSQPIPVDVRLICATSRDIEKMVREGTFREDLYFRVSVVNLRMPPLREREGDIALLAEYFLKSFAKEHNKRARGFTPAFLHSLAAHHWPGNVRELQNVIERSLVLADDKEQLTAADLPPELRSLEVREVSHGDSFHDAVHNFKRELVRAALRLHSGNKLRAAQELRISRVYLHRLLNLLNITDGGRPAPEPEELMADDEAAALAGTAAGSRSGTRVH